MENKVIIYTANDGKTKIDVKLEEETLWLTQAQMCELYQSSKSNVSEHIKHIFEEGELNEESVVRKFRTTAIHGHTAAELIVERADAEKDFMGLLTFKGNHPTLIEAKTAKNYLNEKELRAMGQLVSGYLDFAERQAEREQVMTMNDWAAYLDRILTMSGEQLLQGSGCVSHEEAMEHATTEYRKYKQRTISDVERDYLFSIKSIEDSVKKNK